MCVYEDQKHDPASPPPPQFVRLADTTTDVLGLLGYLNGGRFGASLLLEFRP